MSYPFVFSFAFWVTVDPADLNSKARPVPGFPMSTGRPVTTFAGHLCWPEGNLVFAPVTGSAVHVREDIMNIITIGCAVICVSFIAGSASATTIADRSAAFGLLGDSLSA
jgi:hypothetical protein